MRREIGVMSACQVHRWVALVILLDGAVSAPAAEQPGVDLFRSVRADDVSAVRALLAGGADVGARDADGDTPLIEAAFYSSPEVVGALLAAGADVDASNLLGVTPLHRAATRPLQAALLLDAGADVRARTQLGNSALVLAAREHGASPTLRRLLDAGAEVGAANAFGATALMAAAAAQDAGSVRLLLDRGADIDAKPLMDGSGFILGGGRTALMWAAFRGDEGLVRLLLERGARTDGFTLAGNALTQAAWASHTGVARILLDAGADSGARDLVADFTPLHWAASSERADPAFAALLLERGADPAAGGGDPVDGFLGVPQTPLMLARYRGETPVVAALLRSGARETPSRLPKAAAAPAPDQAEPVEVDPEAIATAVSRAIPPLQKTASGSRASFLRHASRQDCLSCHQQYLPMAAVGTARALQLPVDEGAAREQVSLSLQHPTLPKDFEAQAVFHPEPAIEAGYHLLGLRLEKQAACDLTDSLVHYLSVSQAPDGRWHANLPRPPLQSSDLTATAFAVFSLRTYPIPSRRAELDDQVRRAAAWLRQAEAVTNEELAFQLLGLFWAGEKGDGLAAFATRLASEQRTDGGWAQLPKLPSDAYATGISLYALAQAGRPDPDDPVVARAVGYLLRTQTPGGTWHVRRRAFPFQPPMESGFPHGADSWISAAATSWAAMALGSLLDPSDPPRPRSTSPAAGVAAASPPPAAADLAATGAGAPHDFSADIRPLLERSCLACHSGDRPKGGFRVDSRSALLAGGNRGEANVVPGKPEASPLLDCVTDQIEDLEMPPLGKREKFPPLGPTEVASFRAWIASGAGWPEGVTLRSP
jgi:ankyrin repeat protein